MSALAAQQEHYKAVRARLLNPPNAFRAKLISVEREEHLDPPDIKMMYKEVATPQTPNYMPPMKRFIHEFAAKTPFTYGDLVGPSRQKDLVQVRFDLIYAMRIAFPGASLPQMGRAINKDHTSLIHALRQRGYYDKPKAEAA